MVRDTLGEDAVIVATREEKGGTVSVTAAVEPAFELGRGHRTAAVSRDWLQYDSEDEELAVAEEITDVMLRHNVPEHIMDNIISCATVIGLEQPKIAMIAAIEHLFHFRALPQSAHKKPIMMVGPPGAGKTLAVAKMAARGVMDGLNVSVISTDAVRAGGFEQLQAFTKLLKTDLQRAETPRDLKHAIQSIKEYDQVIIDTQGTNPFDQDDLKILAKMMSVEEVDPYLVLPAGGDAEEAGEMARSFSALGVHTLVSTRLDIARRLGSLLSAAHHGNLAFAEASHTPKVANGFTSLTPKSLTARMMPGAKTTQSEKNRTQ